MSAPPSLSTSRLRHARTLVTAGALAAGSFALAVACGSSAPAPAQPKVIANGYEPDAGAGGSEYGGFLASLPVGDAFASLTGTGDIDSGFDDADIYGGLLGAGDAYGGGFGFGTSGFGYGGGGTGWGTIGTGKHGTIGHGSGTGGYGQGGRGHMVRGVASVTIGTVAATGSLDKKVIRRHIRRQLPQIRACYERRLEADPTLAGKVSTEFTIDPDSNVTVQAVTGFDAEVDTCIETALATIAFPKPEGGGAVKVKCPFVFLAE